MAKCTVYFDGACPLCSQEIGFYRSREGASDFRWIDVSVDSAESLGADLDREQALARLHVRSEDGRLVYGPAAFLAIWSRLPSMRWLAKMFDNRVGRLMLSVAYRGFLILRPAIPRRRHS